MARFVSVSTKRQVKEAVKTESEKKSISAVAGIPDKKKSPNNHPLTPIRTNAQGPSDQYVPPQAAPPKKEEAKQKIKDSIEAIVAGKEETPPDTNKKVIDALIDSSAQESRPPSIEASVSEPGAAYRQARHDKPDAPADFYRAAAGHAHDRSDNPDSAYLRDQTDRHNDNPLHQYASKDSHQTGLDSRGQSDVFGIDEHTLSGRIKKMYQRF